MQGGCHTPRYGLPYLYGLRVPPPKRGVALRPVVIGSRCGKVKYGPQRKSPRRSDRPPIGGCSPAIQKPQQYRATPPLAVSRPRMLSPHGSPLLTPRLSRKLLSGVWLEPPSRGEPGVRLELPSRGERPLPSSRAGRGTSCRAFGGHTLRARQYYYIQHYYIQPKRNKPLTQPRGTGSAARFLTAPAPFA